MKREKTITVLPGAKQSNSKLSPKELGRGLKSGQVGGTGFVWVTTTYLQLYSYSSSKTGSHLFYNLISYSFLCSVGIPSPHIHARVGMRIKLREKKITGLIFCFVHAYCTQHSLYCPFFKCHVENECVVIHKGQKMTV